MQAGAWFAVAFYICASAETPENKTLQQILVRAADEGEAVEALPKDSWAL
jgi:hypothetical protein